MNKSIEKAFEESWLNDYYHDNYKGHVQVGFYAGAEWQAKQSPWIDTRVCKGPILPSNDDCILILEDGHVTRGYYNKQQGWLEYPDYQNILDDVYYFMECNLLKNE